MSGKDMTLDVLGTTYQVCFRNYDELGIFKAQHIDGYCDEIRKVICVCNMQTYPGFEDESEEYCMMTEKQVLRHEIVHAFLNESGLAHSALEIDGGWARNEEMVDWIALQFPKILKAYQAADAL